MSSGYATPPPPPSPAQQWGTPQPPYAPYPPRPRKSRAWIIVAAVLGGVLLLVVFVAGIISIVFGAIKSSEPYQHAVAVATHDRRVTGKLGAPVEPGWFFQGSIEINGASGRANLAIPVQGALGKGTVCVVAKKDAGQWTYQTLELKVEGQAEEIDLLQPSNSVH